MGWSLPLPPPPLPSQEQQQQLDRLHKSYQIELEQSRLQNAAMARRMARLSERFASHLFDVRRRHILRLCFQALRSQGSGSQGAASSTPTVARTKEEPWSESWPSRADKLEKLELEEHLEQVAHVSETRLRRNRVACAMQLLHVRRQGLMRLCLMALRAHATHSMALRNSYAASFIAHRLVGRDVLGIVLRAWRQHVVQLISTRELHAQLSTVVNERLQAAEAHYNALLDEQVQSSRQQLAALRCRLADAAVVASHRATLASCWRILRLHTASSKMVRERRSWREVLQQHAFEQQGAAPASHTIASPERSGAGRTPKSGGVVRIANPEATPAAPQCGRSPRADPPAERAIEARQL